LRRRVSSPTPAGHIRTAGGEWSKLWESEADGQSWFDDNVKPKLPPDVVPIRTYYPLHSAFTA